MKAARQEIPALPRLAHFLPMMTKGRHNQTTRSQSLRRKTSRSRVQRRASRQVQTRNLKVQLLQKMIQSHQKQKHSLHIN